MFHYEHLAACRVASQTPTAGTGVKVFLGLPALTRFARQPKIPCASAACTGGFINGRSSRN
jgi:hypothetical protein